MQEVKSTGNAESATAEVRAQHTPGPWEVDSHGKFNGHTRYYITKSPNHIAECREEDGSSEANARLIAAAPELLKACKSVLGKIDVHTENMSESEYEESGWDDSWRLLRAAICKAGGN